MKASFFLFFLCALSAPFVTVGQGFNNKKPKIVGQDALNTQEDQNILILMTHLEVEDPDDWFYPWGFTMQLYPGQHYSLQGNVVIPAPDFHGKLSVPVTVHDGQDESGKYNLEITVLPVNDRPVVTGHVSLTTDEEQALAIQLAHLKVTDPDDTYPDDFTLRLYAGNNYSVDGNNVTPRTGFTGTLQVSVRVNDGQLDSETYALPVEVRKVNRIPQITGQAALQVNEDEALAINFSHLTVVDEDNNYPAGFTMALSPGPNYSVENNTITPSPDFFGRLNVAVTVNDGQNTSKPFTLSVSVTPVNDLARILDLESEPVFFGTGDESVPVSENLSVADVDGDSIMFAEIGIRPENYQATVDKLVYTAPGNSRIRGVFDPNKGTMTLLGQASPEAYSAAIRAVHYQNIAPASGQQKIIYFVVNDGKSDSEILDRSLVIGQASVSLDIPTGFTPNGDLSNDTWKIVALKSEEAYTGAQIRVYNKAGALVYESIGFESEWDGRLNGELLPADTYFYTIDLNINSPEGYLKGLVTILR